MSGKLSSILNSVLRFMRSNATVVTVSEIGDCYANDTCTGAYEMLRTGQFNVMGINLPLEFAPGINITARYPIYVGPRSSRN